MGQYCEGGSLCHGLKNCDSNKAMKNAYMLQQQELGAARATQLVAGISADNKKQVNTKQKESSLLQTSTQPRIGSAI